MEKPHCIHYENNVFTATGVKEVQEFSETEIRLLLEATSLVIRGKALAVSELVIRDGKLTVTGDISALDYGRGGEKTPILKRLFK